ncbi:MAG: 16S rRNA (uracil(1498)-N(3))-methyltransferase [Flavobacteriaceae bacterium]|nr:16S rRNA (uracil(1498)-N(3))-methyltransferase [Flavobacteriaceae bacterium]
MNLFYLSSISEKSDHIIFDKDESRHIGKVLRKQEGDTLYLTNGRGFLFTAELSSVTPKRCEAKILMADFNAPLPYFLHLAVAPTKLNDRFEWFLEKATEIGISEITPILCDNSERKVIKLERFEKIIQSAMKQSLRTYLPKINKLTPFNEFIETQNAENNVKLIAHCEDGKKQEIRDYVESGSSVVIMIGPEGDFSHKEIEISRENYFNPITLGNFRLRTETAALATCVGIADLNRV